MVSWTLVYTKQAQKDAKKIASSGLRPNVERLLGILAIRRPTKHWSGTSKAPYPAESTSSIASSTRFYRKNTWSRFFACGPITRNAATYSGCGRNHLPCLTAMG